jgi:hypothetical protein
MIMIIKTTATVAEDKAISNNLIKEIGTHTCNILEVVNNTSSQLEATSAIKMTGLMTQITKAVVIGPRLRTATRVMTMTEQEIGVAETECRNIAAIDTPICSQTLYN